jgi:hypothetical protein
MIGSNANCRSGGTQFKISGGLTNGAPAVQVVATGGLSRYTLERSADMQNWTSVCDLAGSSEQPLCLQDTNPPPGQAYYRVRRSDQ